MTRNYVVAIATLASAMILTGCATNSSRFEWGNYESALYVYSKKPDKRPEYQAALQAAIEKGHKEGKVAPGMLAELGYLYLDDGNVADAIPLFEEEMRTFPESRPFLTTVITWARGPQADNSRAANEQKP